MTTISEPNANVFLYRRLLAYALPYKWIFVISVIGMAAHAVTSSGIAVLMKPLMDGGFINKDAEVIRTTLLYFVALGFLRGLSTFFSDYTINWIGRKVIFDIRNALFVQMTHLPSAFYDRNPTGTLISKLIYDVEQIASAVTQAPFVLGREGFTIIALMAWMLYLDWRLTLVLFIIAPVILFIIKIMSHRIRKASRMVQASVGEISQITQEAAEGQRVVKAFCGQEAEFKAFTLANNTNRRQAMKKIAVSALGTPVVQVLAILAIVAITYFALASGKTAGDFVSFFTSLTLLMNPLKQLTKINDAIQAGLAASQSVFGLLDLEREADIGTIELTAVKGEIEYRHIYFLYPGSEQEVLQDISFHIRPGKTLALVGSSGSGKTTVANLLPRFYSLVKGDILLDGTNINDIKLNNLRHHIALVGQETLLFEGTIFDNIVYGHQGPVDERKVLDAAAAAHVMVFAGNMPDGLHTSVGEKGLRLSGGQRQRITIARALYKNAPILILDEATSSLDSESERHVQAAMQQLMKNRTTLVIAHRLSTIEHADQIVVLAQGRVVETGTHTQLLSRNAVYAGLYHTQFNIDRN